MTPEETRKFADATAACIIEAIDQRLRPAQQAITALQGLATALALQVEHLKARPPFEYVGPFQSGKQYRRGQFATWNGSLWHCNEDTTTRPGDGPSWTLSVKGRA